MRAHRPRGRLLRHAQALSQRGLLHRSHLSADGSPSGKRCCSTPNRKSRAHGKSTWDTIFGRTSRWIREAECRSVAAPSCPFLSSKAFNSGQPEAAALADMANASEQNKSLIRQMFQDVFGNDSFDA